MTDNSAYRIEPRVPAIDDYMRLRLQSGLTPFSREAAEKGIPLEHHAAHLIVHGLLHLAGHDHELGDAQADEMEGLERKALALMGIADPYAVED